MPTDEIPKCNQYGTDLKNDYNNCNIVIFHYARNEEISIRK